MVLLRVAEKHPEAVLDAINHNHWSRPGVRTQMKKQTITTHLWDAAAHLETEEDMALYLEAALEEKDPALISAALGDIARVKGMAEIAEKSGLGRTSLYKALSPDGHPEFATILKVVDALGFEFCVTPVKG